MCTKDAAPASCAQPPPAPAPAAVSPPVPDSESDGDDVWADDASDGEGEQGQHQHQQHREGGARATPLDREWAARKQSYHSAGFREGVAAGKEVTLQQGFNAGFSEGAQAGYELGLVKGGVQALSAQLPESHPAFTNVQQLQQQLAAVDNKTAMRDTCQALLAAQPQDEVAAHLAAALRITGAAATGLESSSAQQEQQLSGAGASSSSSAQQAQSLPQQLVAHMKQELQALGFDVGAAPPLTVAVAPAADADDSSS